ncbi:MAG: DUF1028 domain-containing protein [Actinobacteria bacterium]|nr:DUF1028 domain-containing protein [Actinomycetota bacterium]
MTYSLVARDPETGELGIAVQSRSFGTGRVVPWAAAGVGAVATQSFSDPSYGPLGLELLRGGTAPDEALAQLLERDRLRDFRQVAFVDAQGRTASHTGAACIPASGALAGDGSSAQGNMLRSDEVWQAAAEGFVAGTGSLAERLLAGLDAAEAAGGDFRGRQAGAILVVAAEGEGEIWGARVADVRVDDHPEPLGELRRLLRIELATKRLGGASPESLDDELERARDDGVAEDVRLYYAALLTGKVDDAEGRRRLSQLEAQDARWTIAYDAALRMFELRDA